MTSLDAYKLLHEGTLALARAERVGLRVDFEYITKKTAELDERIDVLERRLKNSKFYRHWEHTTKKSPNIYSNAQLANFLYGTKKIKPAKQTESGQGATDEEALTALDIPELNDLLAIRKLKKVRDTYLQSFQREQVNSILHPSFNLHLARTYRSSSDRPNFQNIPKRDKEAMQLTRRALYPRPGNLLLEADYSGLEVRIAACYHKDPNMLEYIRTGYDMHSDMAKQLFKIDDFDRHRTDHSFLRSATKNGFVFPEFYGDYYRNCAENMAVGWGGLPKNGKWKDDHGAEFGDGRLGQHMLAKGIGSLDQFIAHVKDIENDFWGRRFKVYAQWKERWWRLYQRNGFVDLLTGFRCQGVMSRNDAINYPVQGAAFHCLLWSFIELDKWIRDNQYQSRIVGQIHDAIVFDIYPPELDELLLQIERITTKELPKAWPWIIVPLEVDFEICPVDGSWAEKKELVI